MIRKRTTFGIAAVVFLLLAVVFTILLILEKQDTEQQTTVAKSSEGSISQISEDIRLPKNDDGSYRLPADFEGWYRIGTGKFILQVKGTIDFGGIITGRQGVKREGPGVALAPAPDLPLGAVIAKIGETGQPFVVDSVHQFNTEGKMAYIAVNDTNYKDNTGSYYLVLKPEREVVAEGFIPVDKPWTFVGKLKGRMAVTVWGTAILYPKIGPSGPEGVNFPATANFPLPNANEWCALVKYNDKIEKLGSHREFSFDSDTELYFGPNDGGEGAGLSDNSGSWSYKVISLR